MKKKDWIFECNKCEHQVYVDKGKIKTMLKYDCPECGEEPERNWTLLGEGVFKG